MEALILSGAFDWTGLDRRDLLWQIGLFYRPVAQPAGAAALRPRQLAMPLPTEQDMVPLRPLDRWGRLVADYATLGLSPVDHPMALLRTLLPQLHEGVARTAQLEQMNDGLPVSLAGMVVCRQQPETAKGFVFLLIEDEAGLANVVVRPQVQAHFREAVRLEPFVMVQGLLERRDGVTNVLCERIARLSVPPEMRAPEAHDFA